MRKLTSPAEKIPLNVLIVSLDSHLGGGVAAAEAELAAEIPGLTLRLHSAAEWNQDPQRLEACRAAIGRADLIVVTMLFMDDHIDAVREALEARRAQCDAMVCIMSAPAVATLTRMGGFDMQRQQGGGLAWLKKLRGGNKSNDGENEAAAPRSAGARQMSVLRRLPQVLRFIPGTAQDLRAYLLVMHYWLLGSQKNIANMVRLLISRYASGERSALVKGVKPQAPEEYPEVGIYHPALKGRMTADPRVFHRAAGDKRRGSQRSAESGGATVGLLIMRSYVLAENTAHYDRVIAALEDKGLTVLPVFASGLDARPAIEAYFLDGERVLVDAVVSLTGFSLVGGPAYNDSQAAVALLKKLNVPYLSAQALEFQSLSQWQTNPRGLLPLETVMMVAIPELDGATGTSVYGGRTDCESDAGGVVLNSMQGHPERARRLAERVASLVGLRRSARSERRLAIVLFNFPPNSGGTGTAAHLSVFESLFNLLRRLAGEGYQVELPETVDDLRALVVEGNAAQYGATANVHLRMPVDDYVRCEPNLAEIEEVWGAAPGKVQSDGSSLQVLGVQLGNVFIGVQPAFGYEGDPMRLMFEGGHAPNHAFAAFYHFLREDFAADAVLHFGTHGALEFMPGKQVGLGETCWPDRLIGDLPNFYLYAANNPSEATIAKRRSAATVITHLTPPLAASGLYRELADVSGMLERLRSLSADDEERGILWQLIREQAVTLGFKSLPEQLDDRDLAVSNLLRALAEVEETLIPVGMHVVGARADDATRRSMLAAIVDTEGLNLPDAVSELLLARAQVSEVQAVLESDQTLGEEQKQQCADLLPRLVALLEAFDGGQELPALVNALDGAFVPPAAGGDILRNPDVLPTGRNIHGFDPMRMPSSYACEIGRRQADELLRTWSESDQRKAAGCGTPATVAMVLWGTDNLKSEGVSVGQVLALIGARPRFDAYGRLSGASLVPLAELGRSRVDVLVTLSGIFRDLLPNQIHLLSEAALLAASADEPLDQNPIRRHALAYQEAHGVSIEEAALRVFSNADGTYGANVNHMIDNGLWQQEDELGEMFARRKCYAYGVDTKPVRQQELLHSLFSEVDLTYQNLDSVEVGVTTVDHYFDSLGGISKAVEQARGEVVPSYIGDQTRGQTAVRTLADQVALETRTRLLNPKWYEEMFRHGHEGVHQLEVHITNTLGWSATTGAVAPWIYDKLTETFLLDEKMRNRIAELNPAASLKLANRLIEAHERNYWQPDDEVLNALKNSGDALEDRMEGVGAMA